MGEPLSQRLDQEYGTTITKEPRVAPGLQYEGTSMALTPFTHSAEFGASPSPPNDSRAGRNSSGSRTRRPWAPAWWGPRASLRRVCPHAYPDAGAG